MRSPSAVQVAVTLLEGMFRIAGKPGFIFTTRGSASVGRFSTAKLAQIDMRATGEALPHRDISMTCAGLPPAAMANLGIAP